jgi:uncharacterized protein YjbI with pentapeptide repeats
LVSKPDLPKVLPVVAPVPILEPAATIENAEIHQPTWAGQTSKRLTLDTVRLVDPDLTSASLREGGWSDVEISGGQLGGLNLTGTSLRRALIARARLSGVVFTETEIKDVTFEDAKLDLANFRHAKLSRVQFIRCQLIDAAFGGAQLTDVTFTNCDLTSAEFAGAHMKRVDLRSSTLASIQGIGGLAGAIINSNQMITLLPEFAANLEIEVKND